MCVALNGRVSMIKTISEVGYMTNVLAEWPGRVAEVHVNVGDTVESDQELLTLESMKMLTWGLRNFDTIRVSKKDEELTTLKVWLGKKSRVDVITEESLYLTIPKRKKKYNKSRIGT